MLHYSQQAQFSYKKTQTEKNTRQDISRILSIPQNEITKSTTENYWQSCKPSANGETMFKALLLEVFTVPHVFRTECSDSKQISYSPNE